VEPSSLARMSGVLVLNATFEPLTVVSIRRAVCLVLADKVETLHETGGAFRSERLSVAVPSVVRLARYVKVPHTRRRTPNRRAVFVRDSHRCQYCNGTAETVDHVTPRSRGGTHSWENVVAACHRCNAAKRDRLLAETSMRLRRRPGMPPASAWVEVAVGSIPSSWEPYLLDRDLREHDRRSA
jgi:5-methylcytosine-specific restriction endonuclease McrA